MDTELLNGVIMSYSKILKEIEEMKRDIKMILNNGSAFPPTPSNTMQSQDTKKRKIPRKKKSPAGATMDTPCDLSENPENEVGKDQ
jgi:hypothetical protein